MRRQMLPLAIFLVLVVVLGIGLTRDPTKVPSPLIGRRVPEFSASDLVEPSRSVTQTDLIGHVSVVNVWASWCTSCKEEHPYLVELSQRTAARVIGLNYKDSREAALEMLKMHGNPYRMIAFDPAGKVAIDWGVYGVPETFVVDSSGLIRYKHIGPVNREVLENEIIPLIEQLRGDNA